MDTAKQLSVILRELHGIRDRIQGTEYGDVRRLHALFLELTEAVSLLAAALAKAAECRQDGTP